MRCRRLLVFATVLGCIASCSRDRSPKPKPTAAVSEAPSVSSRSKARGPRKVVARPEGAPVVRKEGPVSVAQRWGMALARADLPALREMYAPEVDYRGERLLLEPLLERIEQSPEASTSGQLSVHKMRVKPLGLHKVQVTLEKRWREGATARSQGYVLELQQTDAGYRIIGEAPVDSR